MTVGGAAWVRCGGCDWLARVLEKERRNYSFAQRESGKR